MWIRLESLEKIKFAALKDRATIGRSQSNSIVIEEKAMPSLKGQFFQNASGRWSFKDFQSESEFILESDKVNLLDSFRMSMFSSEEELWAKNESQILYSFRKSLKESSEFELSSALTKLKSELFGSSEIPLLVQRQLERKFEEFRLLGPIENLLQMPSVTDILVEDFNRIWIEESGILKLSEQKFTSADSYKIYIENLLSGFQKSVDESYPFVDFLMPDGSRGHLISPPTTDGRFYLSIRKKRQQALRINDLLNLGAFDESFLQILHEALESRLNILVSGGTGSGKTTLIKALLAEIPVPERLVIIEDVPELELNRMGNIYLRTRQDARGELPQVSLRDLVRQSLRMRPDRLIVGEVRGPEALDLMHAMNTGHQGCLGTIHANSARDAVARLEGLIQMAEASLSERATRDLMARNLNLIIQVGKRGGKRRVLEYGYVRGIDEHQLLMEIHSCV